MAEPCCNHNCEEGRKCPERVALLRRRLEPRDIGVECYLPSRFVNEPLPQDDTPAPNLRWFLVVVVLAFALAAIRAFH